MASAGSSSSEKKKSSSEKSDESGNQIVRDTLDHMVHQSEVQMLEARKIKMKGIYQKQKELMKTSMGRSAPPKHCTKKTEYVKTIGAGHEASGAGDYGGGGGNEKDDHGGGGGGGGGGGDGDKGNDGDGGGGSGGDKEDRDYCAECDAFILSINFKEHLWTKHNIIA